MTSTNAQLWDLFADEVLPWIGLPQLSGQLRSVCPDLPPERIDYWVARINSSNRAVEETAGADEAEWTHEEVDGIWYDHMKAIALDCIQEAADLGGDRGSVNRL